MSLAERKAVLKHNAEWSEPTAPRSRRCSTTAEVKPVPDGKMFRLVGTDGKTIGWVNANKIDFPGSTSASA